MKILAIETSCDETAISVVEGTGTLPHPGLRVLSEITISQLALHVPFGGVVPMVAKREHQKTLVPILIEALTKAQLYDSDNHKAQTAVDPEIEGILEREPELLSEFRNLVPEIKIPDIDAIAVTVGPGLEPALWVGINFAKALGHVWKKPIIGANHMEGHLYAFLADPNHTGDTIKFPAIGLLVSGGHTELVLVNDWCEYELLGSTRDDALGEAFDKVARILGLPYPGGPAISKLAEQHDPNNAGHNLAEPLPRPMIRSHDFDFSFSGLKTAVLYRVKKLENLDEHTKIAFAREFQDAVIDVVIEKTKRAIEKYNAGTLIIGGGVSANKELRLRLSHLIENSFPDTKLFIPAFHYSTDNATMIGAAAYIRSKKLGDKGSYEITASGNLSL